MVSPSTVAKNRDSVRLWAGAPVCLLADGVARANAADAARSPAVAVVVQTWPEKSSLSSKVQISVTGLLQLYDWGATTGTKNLTPGASYYLSNVPGKLSTTPFPAGYVTQQAVGIAVDQRTLRITLAENSADLNVIEAGSQNAGDVLTSTGTGRIWAPPAGSGMGGTGGWINAKDDFGAVGDWATDDTDALQSALLAGWNPNWTGSTDDRWRTVFLPPGTYRVRHPIIVPWYRHFLGCGRGLYGTVIKASPDFDVNWNIPFAPSAAYPSITRIPPAILQSNTWAPDPTGQHRWVFNGSINWPSQPWSVGSYWNGALIDCITIDGSSVAGLNGVCVDTPAENLCFRNLWIMYCGGTGMWLTGNHTGPVMENSSIWLCGDNGIKATTNPFFAAIGRNNPDGNVDGYTLGHFTIKGLSGDGNTPAFFYVTQPLCFTVVGHKYEAPLTPDDNVIRFDVDPVYIGTNTGMNQGGRPFFNYEGGITQNRINMGPFTGQYAQMFCRIMKTGASNYGEFPKPTINLMGVLLNHRNILLDETNQVWPNSGAPTSRIVGLDAPIQADKLNVRGICSYSNDTNEFSGIRMHQFSHRGTTLWLPDGSANNGS